MSVTLNVAGSSFTAGAPVALVRGGRSPVFGVAPDGRFLIQAAGAGGGNRVQPFTVIQNWPAAFREFGER